MVIYIILLYYYNIMAAAAPVEDKFCNTDTYFLETGTTATASDGKHDFKLNKDKMIELVNPNLPIPIPPDFYDNFLSENDFLAAVMGIPEPELETKVKINIDAAGEPNFNKVEPAFGTPAVVFNPALNYEAFSYIQLDQSTLEEKDKFSYIQTILNAKGIREDIFVICDVSYHVRADLGHVKESMTEDGVEGQTFYWTQTLETQFDPAKKTAWHTGAEYGFKKKKSNFQFCWEACLPSNKPSRLFPLWEGDMPKAKYPPQQMITVNKNIYMSTSVGDGEYENYRKHEAILIRNNGTSVSYATSVLASKADKVFSGAEKASYETFGKKIINGLKGLFGNMDNNQTVKDFTDEFHVLSKKFGDAGQALFCCETGRMMHKYADPVNGGAIVQFMSNKNNMFVSYDKIAVGEALSYNAPLVLYEQNIGGVLFIRKDLMDINDLLAKTLIQFNAAIQNVNSIANLFAKQGPYVAHKARVISLCTNYTPPIPTVDIDVEVKNYMQPYFKNVWACLISLELMQSIETIDTIDKIKNYIKPKQDELTNILTTLTPLLTQAFNITISTEDGTIGIIDITGLNGNNEFDLIPQDASDENKKIINNLLNKLIAIFSNIKTEVQTNIEKIELIAVQYGKLGMEGNVVGPAALPKFITKNIESFKPQKFFKDTFQPSEQVLFTKSSEIFMIETVIRPIWTIVKKTPLKVAVEENIRAIIERIKVRYLEKEVTRNAIGRALRPTLVQFNVILARGDTEIKNMFSSPAQTIGQAVEQLVEQVESAVGMELSGGKHMQKGGASLPFNMEDINSITYSDESDTNVKHFLILDSFLRIILSMVLFVGPKYRELITSHIEIKQLIEYINEDGTYDVNLNGQLINNSMDNVDVIDDQDKDDFYFNALLTQLENFDYTFTIGDRTVTLTDFKNWINDMVGYDPILYDETKRDPYIFVEKNDNYFSISNNELDEANRQTKNEMVSSIELFKTKYITKCIKKSVGLIAEFKTARVRPVYASRQSPSPVPVPVILQPVYAGRPSPGLSDSGFGTDNDSQDLSQDFDFYSDNESQFGTPPPEENPPKRQRLLTVQEEPNAMEIGEKSYGGKLKKKHTHKKKGEKKHTKRKVQVKKNTTRRKNKNKKRKYSRRRNAKKA